jgi:vacuolar iron transporter family protein
MAALSSLVAFAAGAFVVVVPYLFAAGTAALVTAVALFTAALLGVGAGIGALNGRSAWRSAARQLVVGGLAAAVTFGVGHAIGVSIT